LFRGPTIIGELSEPRRLATIGRGIALRVIAHQHVSEGGTEGLDVFGEPRAVLEVELVGSAFLRRQCGHVSSLDRVAENARTQFFVDENPGTRGRHPLVDRLSEAVIDHPLAFGDDVVFISRERRGELEHARDVGMTMIER
jgi:hypothetical protein